MPPQATHAMQLLLVSQAVFFGCFLFFRQRDRQSSHTYLAVFLFVLSLHIGLSYAGESFPSLARFDMGVALGFLYGPLIYLYTCSLVYQSPSSLNKTWGHFAPAMGVFVGTIFGFSLPLDMLAGAVTAGLAAYLCQAFRLTLYHERVLRETRATGQHLTLRWLRHILASLMLIGSIDLIHSASRSTSHEWSPILYFCLNLALLALVNYMVFKGLCQPSLFAGFSPEEESFIKDSQQAEPSSKPIAETLQCHFESIKSIVETQALDRDPELTLNRLAAKAGLSRRQASEAINSIGKQSFSDFINELRIDRACKLLQDPDQDGKTILEILYDVGFNTKSSFYNVFKKKMNQTPTQYRHQVQKSRIAQKSPES